MSTAAGKKNPTVLKELTFTVDEMGKYPSAVHVTIEGGRVPGLYMYKPGGSLDNESARNYNWTLSENVWNQLKVGSRITALCDPDDVHNRTFIKLVHEKVLPPLGEEDDSDDEDVERGFWVEYHEEHHPTDPYTDGIGKSVFVPQRTVERLGGGVLKAFAHQTGLPSSCVMRYDAS